MMAPPLDVNLTAKLDWPKGATLTKDFGRHTPLVTGEPSMTRELVLVNLAEQSGLHLLYVRGDNDICKKSHCVSDTKCVKNSSRVKAITSDGLIQ